MSSLSGPPRPGMPPPAAGSSIRGMALYMLGPRSQEPPQERQAPSQKPPSSTHSSGPDECRQPEQRIEAERVPEVHGIAALAVRQARAVDVVEVPQAEITGLVAVGS